MSCLKNKTALVVGATGGLGKEICKLLVEEVSGLIVTFSSWAKAKESTELCRFLRLQNLNCKIQEEYFDAADIVSLKNNYFNLYSPDIFIYSAGLFHVKNIMDVTYKEYKNFMRVNAEAPFLLTQQLAPYMIKKNWGRIVYVGSSSCYNGSSETGIYSTSKHALLGLSRSFQQELKKYGIKVSCVSPGSMKTEMAKKDIRQDYNTFLEPSLVAKQIVELLKLEGNISVGELQINREIIK